MPFDLCLPDERYTLNNRCQTWTGLSRLLCLSDIQRKIIRYFTLLFFKTTLKIADMKVRTESGSDSLNLSLLNTVRGFDR